MPSALLLPASFHSFSCSLQLQGGDIILLGTDGVWDNLLMNNILQHFVTAFLDLHLKGQSAQREYLDILEDGAEAVYSLNHEGIPNPQHTYWKGFAPGRAVGLKMLKGQP